MAEITRISTSCVFSAVPASEEREAGDAYQDGQADWGAHHDAAAASAAVSARVWLAGDAYQDALADRDGHRDAAAVSAAASAQAGSRVSPGCLVQASVRAESRVSQAAVFPAVSDEHPDGLADSDAEAAVFPAGSDGHPDDQADSDAEAGRRVWLLQAGARLRRLQALKVS